VPSGIQIEGEKPAVAAAAARIVDGVNIAAVAEVPGIWMPINAAIAATVPMGTIEAQSWVKTLAYLCKKIETRLDIEAPDSVRTAVDETAYDAAILAELSFQQRKALSLSNKEFDERYERFVAGVGELKTLEVLHAERAATRGRGGRRGGRGRGSAFQA